MWNQSVTELIGNTPMIQLNNIAKNVSPTILAKIECFNPFGSIKDRVAHTLIKKAEERGDIKEGDTLIEITSGNTGLGLAWQASLLGYKCVIIGSQHISPQKEKIMNALGARVIKCESYDEQLDTADKTQKEIPSSYFVNQLDCTDNPLAHYLSTAPEIWAQTEGKVDYLVAGIGSGGTVTGAGKYIKERRKSVKVIGVDGIGSLYYNYYKNGVPKQTAEYDIEGLGHPKLHSVMDFTYIDQMELVQDGEAMDMSRRLLREEGLFVGASSGAIVCAAMKTAEKLQSNELIVAVLPDIGYTYLETCF